jgi:hypothetical protein
MASAYWNIWTLPPRQYAYGRLEADLLPDASDNAQDRSWPFNNRIFTRRTGLPRRQGIAGRSRWPERADLLRHLGANREDFQIEALHQRKSWWEMTGLGWRGTALPAAVVAPIGCSLALRATPFCLSSCTIF